MKVYISWKLAIVLVLLRFGLFETICQAGYITINTKIQTNFESDRLAVNVELTNCGDEPAYNIQVHIVVGKQAKPSEKRDFFNVNDTFKTVSEFIVSYEKPGNYPIIAWVNFTNVIGHPFSFLSLTSFTCKNVASPMIAAKMELMEMVDNGDVHLKIRNLDKVEKEVQVRLIVPKEISANDSVRKLILKSLAEENLYFPVSNFSALQDANYTIYALMEYEDEVAHYLSSAASAIKMVEKRKLTGSQVFFLIGIPLFMLLLCCLFFLVKKRKNAEHQRESGVSL